MAKRLTTRIKRQRLQALRSFRRLERATDTALERLERRINRILDNNTPITPATAETLIPLYRDFWRRTREMERGLSDFVSFVSEQATELLEVLE